MSLYSQHCVISKIGGKRYLIIEKPEQTLSWPDNQDCHNYFEV